MSVANCPLQKPLLLSMHPRIHPQRHGHRGARGRRPENTLPAIRYALEHGVDGVEMDLCVTADDEIVLHHDLRLNPDTTRDARGEWIAHRRPIRGLPLSELRRYDVGRLRPGGDYAAQFPAQTPIDGARIPTLDECVELIRDLGKNDIVLNLEMKSDANAPADAPVLTPAPDEYVCLVLNKLEQLRLAETVLLQSFDWRLMTLAKKQRPDLKTGFTKKRPCAPADLDKIKNKGGDVFSCDHRALTEPLIQKARDLDLKIYAWTVNDQRDIEKMAKLGVDVITTDYPEAPMPGPAAG